MTPQSDPPRRRCVNAATVLPPRLLRQVQKYCQGLIWVPGLERVRRKTIDHPERDSKILSERAKGASVALLAKQYGLSRERIKQILWSGRGTEGIGGQGASSQKEES